VKFSQTAVVVLKNSFRNYDTVAEMEKLTYSAFQCEMEAGLYYFQQIVACPSSKRFVKALRIGFS